VRSGSALIYSLGIVFGFAVGRTEPTLRSLALALAIVWSIELSYWAVGRWARRR